MGDWIKRIGAVIVACGPAAYDAYARGAGWKNAVGAFLGCVLAHQAASFKRGAK